MLRLKSTGVFLPQVSVSLSPSLSHEYQHLLSPGLCPSDYPPTPHPTPPPLYMGSLSHSLYLSFPLSNYVPNEMTIKFASLSLTFTCTHSLYISFKLRGRQGETRHLPDPTLSHMALKVMNCIAYRRK